MDLRCTKFIQVFNHYSNKLNRGQNESINKQKEKEKRELGRKLLQEFTTQWNVLFFSSAKFYTFLCICIDQFKRKPLVNSLINMYEI